MKICFVTEHYPSKTDGITNRVINTCKVLQSFGHTVFVIYADQIGKTSDILITERPDIIHIIDLNYNGIRAISLAHKLNIPIVISLHTDYEKYFTIYNFKLAALIFWRIARWAIGTLDLIFAPSQYFVDKLALNKIPNAKIWPPGINLDLFSPKAYSEALRKKLTSNKPESPLLIYADRISIEKNVDLLVHIIKNFNDINLAIVGDGPYRNQLEQNLKLYPNVNFLGPLYDQDLASAYAVSDIFLSTSSTETFELSNLEAMATGCLVIAANSSDNSRVIKNEKTGLLFNNKQELIDLVKLALNNTELRQDLASNAYAYAKNFSWEQSTATLQDYYLEILDKKNEP